MMMAMERKSGDRRSAAYQWAEGGSLGDELAGAGAVDAPAVYTPWSRPLASMRPSESGARLCGQASSKTRHSPAPRSYQATTLRPSTVLPCGAPVSRLHTGRKGTTGPASRTAPARTATACPRSVRLGRHGGHRQPGAATARSGASPLKLLDLLWRDGRGEGSDGRVARASGRRETAARDGGGGCRARARGRPGGAAAE
jgi:hypothetical protein